MTNPKVTVIIPVYKVEDYIGRAIESLQAQTLSDFEVLIVDDGSPDKSGQICEDYAAKDSRITVFHQKNSGAPAARNFAMDRARGEYYYFMDGDDFAEPEMLSDMVELAEESGAQLVVAGFYIDTYYEEEKFRRDVQKVDSRRYSSRQEFREDAYRLFDKNLLYTPWNKLWKRSYIEEQNVRFPGTFWDDFPFVLAGIRNIDKVVVTEKCYYHFIRKRAESETASYRPEMYKKRQEEDDWLKDLFGFWRIDSQESREFLGRRYIERFIGCVENLTNPKCNLTNKEKKQQIKQMLEDPKVDFALENACPRSTMMKLMLIPIKMKSVGFTLLEGKTITFVKTRNTKIFSALKAGR